MQLLIPESLKNNAGGQKKVKLTANDIEEFKKELKEKENALYARIYDEKGNQRKFVNIYIHFFITCFQYLFVFCTYINNMDMRFFMFFTYYIFI